MHDLASNLGVQRALASASLTSDTTGVIVDTLGFTSIMFAFMTGAVTTADGSNYFTAEVWESDDGSGFTNPVEVTATASRIIGTQFVINDQDAQDNIAAKFGVTIGSKRYMRLTMNETGTAEAVVGAMAILGGARHAPVS